MGHKRLRPGLVAAVAAALVLTLAGTGPPRALAHADYERSNPPAEGVVQEAPEQLDVWFTQELFREVGANTIEVTGPDGARVDTGQPVLDDADRHHLSVGLRPDLPPGTYTVRWTNLSAEDGDPHEGSFTFTVDPEAEAEAAPAGTPAGTDDAPEPADTSDDDGGGAGGWLLPALLGAAIALVAGGAFALLTRGRGDVEE